MQQLQQSWSSFLAWPYFWDVIALASLVSTAFGFLLAVVWLLGLPGRIAYERKHPDAEAVYLMGWVGFIAVVPWIQALIWAFKPTDKVDIRYLPDAEQAAEREELDRFGRFAYGRRLDAGGQTERDRTVEPPERGRKPGD